MCFIDRIDGRSVGGKQSFGILQHITEELGIHLIFMRAVFNEQVRLLVCYDAEDRLIELQCIEEP